MVKTMVGNRGCILFGIMFFFSLSGAVVLEVRDEEGNRVHEVSVGQPFTLEVVVSPTQRQVEYPVVYGLEQFSVHKNGFEMQTINGVSKARYRYQIRIDTLGQYTLGPALVKGGSGAEQSDPITVSVVTAAKKRKTNGAPYLIASTESDHFWVGQKVVITVRLYGSPLPSIETVMIPDELKGGRFSIGEIEEPRHAVEEKDGTEVEYIEWKFAVYPRMPGSFVIPGVVVDYYVSDTRRHSLFALFNPRMAKQLISNTLTIQVDPLPASVTPSALVGTITKMELLLDKKEVAVGQGATATVVVTGDFNEKQVVFDRLQAVPQALKWYASEQRSERGKKKCEFVLQAVEPGSWEIPAQTLGYFDVGSGQYREIASKPQTLMVTGQAASKEVSSNTKEQTVPDFSAREPEHAKESTHLSLPRTHNWKAVPESSLSRKTFWILFLLPLIVLLILKMVTRLFHAMNSRRSVIYARARRRLKQAQEEKDYLQVLDILNTLYAHEHAIAFERRPLKELQKWGAHCLPEKEKKEWALLLEKIYYIPFSDKQEVIDEAGFEKLYGWLELWERSL